MNRHNAVLRMMATSLARQGLKMVKEPRLEAGNRKGLIPDLVCATKDKKKIQILDPLIYSEH